MYVREGQGQIKITKKWPDSREIWKSPSGLRMRTETETEELDIEN